ncbi:unnamed protein product [Lactuca saligna]|uniref:TIR domain-containing protein n=1 Tax=Lactuca saligna TaxID=75948 RepID=A0AA35YDI2_LACSI|nr:unnamed protein product [Lactuca saligna]
MHANITTFLDDEDIETGEDLKPELGSTINSSRAFVIVLSRNYAASTWCPDELVLILEQQTYENKKCQWAQKIDRWNKELIEVVDLKGKDANGRLEVELIDEIVNDIFRKLQIP